MYRLLILVVALSAGIAAPLAAQRPDSIAIDVSVGPSSVSGSKDFYNPGTAAGEFTMSFGPIHTSGRIFALTIGGNLAYSVTDVCEIDETRTDRCKAIFPSTTHIGILGGFHFGRPRAALRAMIGPVAFAGGGESGAGAHLQVDASTGFTHVAFLLAGRQQVLRRANGENLFIRSLGLGVRFQ